ncbi:MAG: ABC transporter ATP-binding protein [Thaumarchaeota archaeon]|nr:ABC transporter ATP-binding protein [Nitrososphaerota archaeon]
MSSQGDMVLSIQGVSRLYNLKRQKTSALKELDLDVRRGEFIAIMGRSGSGKTTLLNIMSCLDRPTAGKVLLDGVDVTAASESDLNAIRRDKVGFVFQSYNLLPYLSARENVELALESKKLSKSERSTRARELLTIVGLEGVEEHRPQQLSGGEQQRVAIARALANNPAIVLADELTGNLDSETKTQIVKFLTKLNRERGTTIIMVTHDESVACRAERILYLKGGRIAKESRGNLAKTKEGLQRHTARKEDAGADEKEEKVEGAI